MSEVLTELVAKITTDATGLKSGLATADRSIGSFVTKNVAGLRSLGVAFAAIGTAIVGGLGASAKAAVDFETAFTGVRKTVDATDEQFAVLSKGIRDLTKELPLTHAEIAGIAEAAGQLGIETESILDFSKVMAQLGMTTNLAAKDAATALARFANITQMSQDNFENLGAVIVDLGNNFATTEAEIVGMAMRLAGSGSTVGMSEAQILALSAALSSVGIRAERGGTAFSRVMLEMNSAIAAGGDELEKWAGIAGVATAEFKRRFKDDAAGAVMDFIGGIGRLKESGADVSGVLDTIGLGGIRVTDALLRAAGAEDLFTNALLTADRAWAENNALTEEARKRMETTASKMGILKNTMVDMGITIGEFIVPILKELVEKLMPIIDNIQAWINENPTLAKTLTIAGAAIGILSLALGGFLLVLPGIISMMGVFGITLSAAIWPVTLVVAAIAALIAIGVLLWKNWDKMSLVVKIAIATMTGGIGLLLIAGIALVKNWDSIMEAVGMVGDAIAGVWEGVWEGTKKVWGNIVGFIEDSINNIIVLANKVINTINKIPFINVGNISTVDFGPKMHSGGVVPGSPGQAVPILAQAGEIITPAGAGGGGGVTQIINIGGSIISEREVGEIAQRGLLHIERLNYSTGIT